MKENKTAMMVAGIVVALLVGGGVGYASGNSKNASTGKTSSTVAMEAKDRKSVV